MGTFLTTTALCAQIPELTYCETYVLLQMSFAADDNTGHNTLNGVQRYNKIGSHVYISIKNLAQTGSFDRGTLNKAVKSLLENGYIRLTTERNTGKQKRSTNTYEINVSKIIRILDYQETVNKLNLDRNNEKVKNSIVLLYQHMKMIMIILLSHPLRRSKRECLLIIGRT